MDAKEAVSCQAGDVSIETNTIIIDGTGARGELAAGQSERKHLVNVVDMYACTRTRIVTLLLYLHDWLSVVIAHDVTARTCCNVGDRAYAYV